MSTNLHAQHPDERVLVLFEAGLTVFERYAQAVQAIQGLLKERFGRTWSIVSSHGQEDVVWKQLDADVRSGNESVECAARVFDVFEAKEWTVVADEKGDRRTSRIQLTPSSRNLLFVYPKDRVAFVRIPVWRDDRIDHESLCLVENEESLVRFMERVNLSDCDQNASTMTSKLEMLRSQEIQAASVMKSMSAAQSVSIQHYELPNAEFGIVADRNRWESQESEQTVNLALDALQFKLQRDCS
ncbi:hypothetical protein NQ117_21830 [Paenibacillus sp. SC116]|uniref:hypothetical protein n=1 Tax=Paenibacillus sp. SC116 TaxID=2968986 RepID=UPI00215AD957|nr:hypothetical protein [Paenibacillus sp. SC116]MCR8846329.1 hypothetical protein [Paenibacillus sp. SC116]